MDSRASYILVAGLSPAVADSLPTYPQDQQAIDEFRGLKVPPGSAVAPGLVTVSVVDGTGTTGQATTTAAQFSSLGFHVVGTGSATSIGPISETVVYYSKGHLLDAERQPRRMRRQPRCRWRRQARRS